jgi:hypothetical protein
LVRDLGSEHDLLLELGTDAIAERTRVAAESAFIGPWYPAETPSAWISMSGLSTGWWRTPLAEQTLETELAIAIERTHANIHDMITTPDGARVFVAWSGPEVLARTRPNDVMRVGQLEVMRTLGQIEVTRLAPSPSGDLLALVHANGDVGVHDMLTLERRWTRVDTNAVALGWAADGTRLVVAGPGGGAVLDAKTGELELERRDLGLHVERKRNLVPAPASEQLPDR